MSAPAFIVVDQWNAPSRCVPLAGRTVEIDGVVFESRDGVWFAGDQALEPGMAILHHHLHLTFLVGEPERALADLRHALATIDPLTRVANRRTFARYVARLASPTIALVDLDRMKRINDLHGMAVGNLVLSTTARRLRGEVRWPVLLARHGGDEFSIAFPAPPARELVERLRLVCEPPIACDGESVDAQVSIGVGPDLRAAETQLDLAKSNGRNRVAWPT